MIFVIAALGDFLAWALASVISGTLLTMSELAVLVPALFILSAWAFYYHLRWISI